MSSTETHSPRYDAIEDWPVPVLVAAITESQYAAIGAVQASGAAVVSAVAAAAKRMHRGGRLIYIGAGTSGRIATQDAAELAPTFAWPQGRALSIMAGGAAAFTTAIEGAEDDRAAARAALVGIGCAADDVVIGLAASGRTPFTVAGIEAARDSGALTIGISNNPGSALAAAAEIAVTLDTGPEVIAGSTRMKAGTAQKVALNVFSTALMVRLGYIYRGRMVEMRPTNAKLAERAVAMVGELTGADTQAARVALDAAEGSIKQAVVMLAADLDAATARDRLARAGGDLRRALAPDRDLPPIVTCPRS